jgi:exosome complex component RRP43
MMFIALILPVSNADSPARKTKMELAMPVRTSNFKLHWQFQSTTIFVAPQHQSSDIMDAAPSLSFPRDTFAKLTPGPFLLAHLKQQPQIRPSGRHPGEHRKPTINTGSLTHSNGSAVVRMGDTAVVCGVRSEILLASDIPHPPSEDATESALVEELGLVVPNVELSTGCSPAHLPGNPPSSLAQSLSYRVLSLLHSTSAIDSADLRIKYTEPKTDEDIPDEEPKVVTKAYWALYVDILCLSLDGNAFDAAWLAVTAALRDTVLPHAWWDPDREAVVCSPLTSESHKLSLPRLPLTSTFAVFTTTTHLKKRDDSKFWVLADPDASEEGVCDEVVTIVLSPSTSGPRNVVRIEKNGGRFVSKEAMIECMKSAEARCSDLENTLRS